MAGESGVSAPWGGLLCTPAPDGVVRAVTGGCREGTWGSGVGTMPQPLGVSLLVGQAGFPWHPGLPGVGEYGMSHGAAEPREGRAGTGPAAEPKGKLKKLGVTSRSPVPQPLHGELAVLVPVLCLGRSFAPGGDTLVRSQWGCPAAGNSWGRAVFSRRPCWLCNP